MNQERAERLAHFIRENDRRFCEVQVVATDALEPGAEGVGAAADDCEVRCTRVETHETVKFPGTESYTHEACQNAGDIGLRVRVNNLVAQLIQTQSPAEEQP